MFLDEALTFTIEVARQIFSLAEQFRELTSLRFHFVRRIGISEKPLRYIPGTLQTKLLFLRVPLFPFPSWTGAETWPPTFSCPSLGNLRGRERPTRCNELLLPAWSRGLSKHRGSSY